MDYISEIINRRSMPGLLIVDSDYTLHYANREAMAVFRAIHPEPSREPEGDVKIPEEIVALCERLKRNVPTAAPVAWFALNGELRGHSVGDAWALRAFFIGSAADTEQSRHIMVLVEKVVKRHALDFGKAKKNYRLSSREIEVVQWICQGFTNKEIALTMYISEYTVKDHIKKIMRNMGVGTRSGIIAALR